MRYNLIQTVILNYQSPRLHSSGLGWRGPTRQPSEDERFGTLPPPISRAKRLHQSVSSFYPSPLLAFLRFFQLVLDMCLQCQGWCWHLAVKCWQLTSLAWVQVPDVRPRSLSTPRLPPLPLDPGVALPKSESDFGKQLRKKMLCKFCKMVIACHSFANIADHVLRTLLVLVPSLEGFLSGIDGFTATWQRSRLPL